MNTINCLIVDDEPIACEIIRNYCSNLPSLNVTASCSNALEARKALKECQTDIMFLDIDLPVLSGVSFLNTLKDPPLVIFTTAYKEFALEAFDLEACDYLLKPFSLERFIIAVDKAICRLNASADSSQTIGNNYSFIRAEGKIYRVMHSDILYAEANGNYTRIFTEANVVETKMPFSLFERLLCKNTFIRVHRSFIVNKVKITHIEGNNIHLNKMHVPIGTNFRQDFFNAIGFDK